MFIARYALSPYIKQIRFVFKGLISVIDKGNSLGPVSGPITTYNIGYNSRCDLDTVWKEFRK
jgi:hypothetical protein